MTCARRPAGARTPASPTSAGPRRPDARTGRARARLSLLPALALLLGALSLFAAAPAEAQTTLLSATLTVAASGTLRGCEDNHATLASCSAALTTNSFTYEGTANTVDELNNNQFGGGFVALTLGFTTGIADAGWRRLTLHLDDKSFPVADADNIGATSAQFTLSSGGPSWTDGQKVQVRLILDDPPAAPTNLGVLPYADSLDIIWDKPPGAVTGYDVHYTSAPAGPITDTAGLLNHPIRNNPAVGWVAVSRSGTATGQTISSLVAGTAYRVRVRARNRGGGGDWAFVTGTTSGTAPPVTVFAPEPGSQILLSATLRVDQGQGSRAASIGCLNGTSLLRACSAALTTASFTYAGTAVSVSGLTLDTVTGLLDLHFTQGLTERSVRRLTLHVDGKSFPAANAVTRTARLAAWSNHGLNWINPQWVQVHLTYKPPTISLSASPNPVQEGSSVTVTATLSEALGEVSIPVYSAAAGRLFHIAIPAGQTTGTHEFTAPQLEDGEMKQYQIAVEWLRMPKSTPLSPKGSQSIAGVTVLDENADPHRVSVSDASGTEMSNGYPRLCFAFTLNRAASHRIWVGYRTENGTAIAGQDYQGVIGSPVIPFEPGETRKRKCITILDDNVEDSGETFSMVLVNPHGAILGRDRGTGTIYNHEPTSLSALTAEGASGEDGPFAALDIGTFAPATTAYSATVPHGTTHVRLTPKSLNGHLTITTGLDGKGKSQVPFGGATATGGCDVAVGENVAGREDDCSTASVRPTG